MDIPSTVRVGPLPGDVGERESGDLLRQGIDILPRIDHPEMGKIKIPESRR